MTVTQLHQLTEKWIRLGREKDFNYKRLIQHIMI